MSNNLGKKVEKYIDGLMTDDEKKIMEFEIKFNQEYHDEYILQSEINNFLKQYSDEQQFKKVLDQVSKKYLKKLYSDLNNNKKINTMNFKIYQFKNNQIIEHLNFPRFKAVITFNSPISDIENIIMIDECKDVMLLAKTMREAGDYIYNFNKNKNNKTQ